MPGLDSPTWMCAACSWLVEDKIATCPNCGHWPLLDSWVSVEWNAWYGRWICGDWPLEALGAIADGREASEVG